MKYAAFPEYEFIDVAVCEVEMLDGFLKGYLA